MKLPNHIVVIPDGNRRWARARGLKAFLGHDVGAKKLEEILNTALELRIHYFTFWASSLDNVLKRPKEEVDFLFQIFEKKFAALLHNEKIEKNRVRVRILGRWSEMFPAKLKELFNQLIKKTETYDAYHLTFLMAYSGIDEMTEAIKKITESKLQNPNLIIDSALVKNYLWTKDLPAVDFVIRTGGEPHWSQGMMMWDVAEAQLYFTETLWPDFDNEEFKKALRDYENRERRFGA